MEEHNCSIEGCSGKAVGALLPDTMPGTIIYCCQYHRNLWLKHHQKKKNEKG